MTDEIIELHVIVHGNVQGVGFRAITRHHANNLKLFGTVKNLSDGTVEIYILGTTSEIERLFQVIKADLGSTNITSMTTKEIKPPRSYMDFRIIH